MARKKTTAALVAAEATPVANGDTEALVLPQPESILAESRRLVVLSTAKAQAVCTSLTKYGAIESADGAALISQVLLAAQGDAKALEAVRTSITKPIDAFKRAVQDTFNPAKEAWADAIGLAKGALAAWADVETARRAQLEAEAQAKFAAGEDAGAVHDLIAASAEPVTLGAGVAKSTRWIAVVTDAKALIKAVLEGSAPANLVEVSDKNLQAYARATKGTATLPGVEFRSETTIAGRG